MMKKLVLRDYATGEVLKRILIPQDVSIQYSVEKNRMVIRNYYTGDKVKSSSIPKRSFTFRVE